jgi:lipoate-protein ligase A
MKRLDLTLPSPAENLALDEALLDAAEAGEIDGDVLRLWESPEPIVILGRSSRAAAEVHVEACAAAGVPVLRRASGGAAVVAGPGCLMYAVILRYAGREHLRLIDQAHRYVLGVLRAGLQRILPGVEHQGTSDLALDHQKFSGNAVRCKRDHLLYHGTLLYAFPLDLMGRLLRMPPRQPEYRGGREHAQFVTNVPLSAALLRETAASAFGAEERLDDWPRERMQQLVGVRYGRRSWNFER